MVFPPQRALPLSSFGVQLQHTLLSLTIRPSSQVKPSGCRGLAILTPPCHCRNRSKDGSSKAGITKHLSRVAAAHIASTSSRRQALVADSRKLRAQLSFRPPPPPKAMIITGTISPSCWYLHDGLQSKSGCWGCCSRWQLSCQSDGIRWHLRGLLPPLARPLSGPLRRVTDVGMAAGEK